MLVSSPADRGIRVNAVAPGPIWTPLIPATMPAEKVEQFGTDVSVGRPGQPAELAPAYVFYRTAVRVSGARRPSGGAPRRSEPRPGRSG
ncbi:hypothetical protein GA0070213_1029 [Micromonospora humi]|uniref:Enoyl-(Acyl carrier protein) reductase n=1 Tax=Micromonospora humi TaxID=745366 RepID=A0A1C5GXW4_9ACTN|nr:hypothetical protein GA0070213_1029 [Micromonospora humi]